MKNAKSIINQIERKVQTLEENEKIEINELVEKYDEGDLSDNETLAYEIASFLRVNENCIYDILTC